MYAQKKQAKPQIYQWSGHERFTKGVIVIRGGVERTKKVVKFKRGCARDRAQRHADYERTQFCSISAIPVRGGKPHGEHHGREKKTRVKLRRRQSAFKGATWQFPRHEVRLRQGRRHASSLIPPVTPSPVICLSSIRSSSTSLSNDGFRCLSVWSHATSGVGMVGEL